MIGWAMAVLVDMVILPLESVEVTGTGIATGLVGRIVGGAGEGVMMVLLDAGAGGFELTGTILLAGSWTAGAASIEGLETGFAAGVVVDVGASSGATESAMGAGRPFPGRGTTGVVSVGAASGRGVVEVGPSSGSVDVEVLVRYNAVCNAPIGPTQSPCDLQFQTPRPGKRFSIILPVSPHVSAPMGRKVQPLGSSIVLTPVACTASGRSG